MNRNGLLRAREMSPYVVCGALMIGCAEPATRIREHEEAGRRMLPNIEYLESVAS